MNGCEQELCGNWTGQGCACEVFDIEPDLRSSCEAAGHPDDGEECCACGMVVFYGSAGSGLTP